jgi:uncharacterized protein
MLRRAVVTLLVAAILLPLFGATAQALDVPPAPKDTPVVDQTNTLTDAQRQAIADKIAAERKSSGNQIAVLMIKTLDGDALEDYSLRVARGWGIGQKERNSGVLLLVVKDDRRLRIEVGYGLEGALTDATSGRIIRDRITPQFKQGKYYEGIDSGIDGIVLAIKGEKDPNLQSESVTQSKPKIPFELIFFAIFVVPVWLGSVLARTKSWWAGGVVGGVAGVIIGIIFGFVFLGVIAIGALAVIGLLFDWLVSKNYQKHAGKGGGPPSWWAGGPWLGGGGSGGGGGFGGFSGGSFGGGGSSGSW